jgi:predicted DNA-binding protein (MmcQ/YjbR family)
MDREAIRAYCNTLPGSIELELGHPKNILLFWVDGKQFAYFKTSEPERWRFSIRVLPERFLELTDLPGVKPARYMGRFHWVTIVDTQEFDTDYLLELINSSYHKAFSSLSKTKQQIILQSV